VAEEVRKLIGDTSGLAFEFRWPALVPDDVEGLGWGQLTLWFAGTRAWSKDKDGPGIAWTWVDLLEHLARAWPFLLYEEVPPFALMTKGPELLRKLGLMKAAAAAAQLDLVEVEDAIHAYQHRHDLAAGLKGVFVPSVWIIPEGRFTRIRHNGVDLWLKREALSELLTEVGEAIGERLAQGAHPRSLRALDWWKARHPDDRKVIRLRTGLAGDLEAWEAKTGHTQWGDARAEVESPLMAAARLSAGLSDASRAQILKVVLSTPAASTPVLDDLSRAAKPVVDALASLKPYEQGHALAIWLRGQLGLEHGPVDPAGLLDAWNVQVTDLPDLESDFDAVAVWGDKHGPAVFVNPEGRYSGSTGGRRATLAHEVLHLLVDRGRHLPIAEVFGGTTPVHLEQRARAFAAEFLAPRDAVASIVASSSSFNKAFSEVQKRFRVSAELAGWQVRNGSGWALLDPSEKKVVRRVIRFR
jgi:Zn-dependent peptidase ImmA (M78 family)